MVKASSPAILEVEIDKQNRNLFLPPLGRPIRGRFDLLQCAEPMAKLKLGEWPQPIPGQRIVFDAASATVEIVEPLHDAEHAATRALIERRGMRLPPARETLRNVDGATWAFWLGRAISSGHARIVRGELPEVAGDVKRDFIVKRQRSETDRLLTGFEKLASEMAEQKQALLEHSKAATAQAEAANATNELLRQLLTKLVK